MPWSEDDFFNKAINTPHPMEAEPIIPDRTKKAILNVLAQSIAEWTKGQTEELERIRQRAKEFKEKEDQAKAKISEAVRRVNNQKQTLLTAELLRKIQYGDMDVVHQSQGSL